MSRSVKPRRRYESPRRREQAAATRQAILEAAEVLFAKQGYVGTSVAEIAEEPEEGRIVQALPRHVAALADLLGPRACVDVPVRGDLFFRESLVAHRC